MVANPFLFLVILPFLWIVLHSTLVTSRALNFCCPLYAISTVSLSVALKLALSCSSARRGLFKLSFTRKETLLANYCAMYGTTILFSLV